MKFLEWVGVRAMDLAAWCSTLERFFNRLAVNCIVAARPIPRPPPLPRIEFPSTIPCVDPCRSAADEPTRVERPKLTFSCEKPALFLLSGDNGGVRVHPDQWSRTEGKA